MESKAIRVAPLQPLSYLIYFLILTILVGAFIGLLREMSVIENRFAAYSPAVVEEPGREPDGISLSVFAQIAK